MRGAFKFTHFLFVVGVFLYFSSRVCSGSDTIAAGQSLFPNKTIISKEGKFEVGFFDPGNSSNYYVGIWYKNIAVKTVVWVLNRDNPIPDSLYNNSQLEIAGGTLLLRSGQEIFYEYNQHLNATEAVILDSGNLVLRNASGILWQSFEHPTDTWLPGAVLGYRWFTDIDIRLVSWRNPNNPASGTWSLGMDPNGGGSDLSIKNGMEEWWSSGPSQGGTFQSLNLKNSSNLTYSPRDGFVNVTYNVYNESLLFRIVIDNFGRMKQFRWSEQRQAWELLMVQPYSCSAYAMCGPNTMCATNSSPPCRCLSEFKPQVERDWDSSDFSSGCVRRRKLQDCTDKVAFIRVTTDRFPLSSETADLPDSVCESLCSNNCSCNAYAYGRGGGCLLFMGDIMDLESPSNSSSGEDIYVKVKPKGELVLCD